MVKWSLGPNCPLHEPLAALLIGLSVIACAFVVYFSSVESVLFVLGVAGIIIGSLVVLTSPAIRQWWLESWEWRAWPCRNCMAGGVWVRVKDGIYGEWCPTCKMNYTYGEHGTAARVETRRPA